MLTTVAVRGYRSLREVVLPFGPLTVITGANGTGKSSVYRALRLLAEDASTDLRERRMQAFVLLLLFRFGLRVQECIALRASDLLRCGETWVVLVRRNAYRQLKSDAGVRQVPLVGPLDPLETEVLQGWLEHADETAGEDRCAVLMSRDEAPRRLVDEQRLRSRITDALRAATGSTTLHPHQLRHGFATRLVLLLATPTWPPDPLRRAILQRLIGPQAPRAVWMGRLGSGPAPVARSTRLPLSTLLAGPADLP